MSFELVSPFYPTGDQPRAIKQLSDGLMELEKFQTLLGVTGSGKTFTIANVIQEVNQKCEKNNKLGITSPIGSSNNVIPSSKGFAILILLPYIYLL